MNRVLISANLKWHLHQTAKAFEKRGALAGYWVSNANVMNVGVGLYRRIWPYHLMKKLFYHLPFPQLDEWSRWWFLPAYDEWVRRQQIPADCDIVMGPMGSCEPLFHLAAIQGRNVLKVCEAPNSHPQYYSKIWQVECDRFAPGYRIPFPGWMVRRITGELSQADVVLCPSLFVKETMVAHGVSETRCIVRHFGVETDVFQPRKQIPTEAVFVCVGSISVRKGHPYLFEAFQSFKQVHPAARLICVGGVRPDMRLEWPKWKHIVEHHEFMNHREIANCFSNATAFILASVEEGFARVLSEAMSAGLPVIATHESGITTVARHQEGAWIIPARDSEAIESAMVRLGTDPTYNRQMGEMSLELGRARNTWQDYGDDVLQLLNEKRSDFLA